MLKCSNAQMLKYSNAQMLKWQMLKCKMLECKMSMHTSYKQLGTRTSRVRIGCGQEVQEVRRDQPRKRLTSATSQILSETQTQQDSVPWLIRVQREWWFQVKSPKPKVKTTTTNLDQSFSPRYPPDDSAQRQVLK